MTSQEISEGSTGHQVNNPLAPVIQGTGNVTINYGNYSPILPPENLQAGAVNYGHNPSPVKPQPGSRVQQLRIDRLQQELDQLAEEYQAVSKELSLNLTPTHKIKLKRLLEQLETEMAAIEAAINS